MTVIDPNLDFLISIGEVKMFKIALTSLFLTTASFSFGQSSLEDSFNGACEQEECVAPTDERREELVAKYPGIAEDTTVPENPRVLCPFLRMLTRAGIFDPEAEKQSDLTVGIIKIATAAREFACPIVGCGGVATAVSAGQLTQFSTRIGAVNLEALHKAVGIAHECGLTFAKGGTEVSDEVRASTLASLKALADEQGHLRFEDLETVKLGICEAQGVEITTPGAFEIGLIYSFLGGNDRGYIEYSDVELFLNAKLKNSGSSRISATIIRMTDRT